MLAGCLASESSGDFVQGEVDRLLTTFLSKGKMSSPGSRRNSCRAVACGSRASSEGNTRRRGSSVSYLSSGAQAEDLSVSLSQPIITITFRFLLAVDLWLSKRLGVCAYEESAWGSIRPLVRLVEFSGHVVPWLIGTVYTLLCRESVVEQEIMLNLFLGKRSNLRFKISTCCKNLGACALVPFQIHLMSLGQIGFHESRKRKSLYVYFIKLIPKLVA